MANKLVAYFSASGVTAAVAKTLAAAAGADLYEITPAQPYTREDLDWTNPASRSTVEMKDVTCRPALCGPLPDLSAYDTLFVGFPIWWGREPSVVDTFVDGLDLAGKKLVPFCTSGSGDCAGATRHLAELTAGRAHVFEGARLSASASVEEVTAWLHSL